VPSPPTFSELQAAGRAAILDRRPDLDDFSEGSALDAITGAGAVQADEVIRVALDRFAALFVDTATGQELDDLAADRWDGLARQAASAAVGQVTIGRGAEVGAFTVDAGLEVSATVSGETVAFGTDEAAVFGAGDATVTVSATCSETGRAGNVAAGTVTQVVNPPVASPTVTVTNAARFAGGADAETDETFRARIRRYPETLRRGTAAAVQLGAESVAGVRFAQPDDSTVSDLGYASLYIGDPEGTANDVLVAAVESELVNWRALGIEVRVFAAERQETPVSATVYVRRGADRATLRDAIRAAIVALGDRYAPNEIGYRSQVVAEVHAVSDDVRAVALAAPVSDVLPAQPYHAVRYPEATVALTLVEVA
jgi:uncharacterized phage protein gp47/JayE